MTTEESIQKIWRDIARMNNSLKKVWRNIARAKELPIGSSLGYTEKLFRITQSGTNAPVVTTAVGNTGIDITPSRLDVGSLRFTFSSSITTANCDFYFQIGQNPNGVIIAFINSITTSKIDVLLFNTSMAQADLGGGVMYMRMIVKP